MIDRRHFVQMTALLAAAPALARAAPPLDLEVAVLAAERSTGGRIGLAVHDTATGRRFSHRGAERFPMASTFKMVLVAAILEQVDRGKERLDRAIPVTARDILDVSPVSKQHVGGTATVAALAEATIIYSDNTAANLLLPAVGGPAGLTAFLRRIGDPVTRLDRMEPMMSEALPGDPRDTTSPDAIATTWERLLLGNILSPASRRQLTAWLVANTTGDTRLRAGLPKGWRVGDKTGTGGHGSVNDVAIVWPVRSVAGPVLIASFVNGGTAPSDTLYAAHAGLARAITAAL
ncbi:class A beta-lactamase [Sandarakinorhabdus sp. DWP1-3-1]|uniref:class A beta-lactamase n=1 Tax=Sandarakinorhabdus sp. DWP1-3-1 TaxID=2804627 RepID=UPI003CED0C38